tara:strand:- start:141 stop:347 length:207 start_codon:yes stop_codon:yes gene_type:complete
VIAFAAEGVQVLVKATRQFTVQPFDCSGVLGFALFSAHVASLGPGVSSKIQVSYGAQFLFPDNDPGVI